MLHFETAIERAVDDFAKSLPPGARVLDAGAGEGNYKAYFGAQHESTSGLDLAVGDSCCWDYSTPGCCGRFDGVLPFRARRFRRLAQRGDA